MSWAGQPHGGPSSSATPVPHATVIRRPEFLSLGPFRPRTDALTPSMMEADREYFAVPASGVEMGYWEGTAGSFPARRDGYTEICHVLSGSATLHTDGGDSVELSAGDSVAFPSGWSGRWDLHEPLRKMYIIVTDP